LNLPFFLHRDAQVLVALALVFDWYVDQAGDTDPASDPGVRGLLLELGEALGPDRDLDDVAAPRAEIDEDIVLDGRLAALARSARDLDDAADQLDAVADILHGGGEIERVDHRKGGDIGGARLGDGRRRCRDRPLRHRHVAAGEELVEGRDRGERRAADRREVLRLVLQLWHLEQAP